MLSGPGKAKGLGDDPANITRKGSTVKSTNSDFYARDRVIGRQSWPAAGASTGGASLKIFDAMNRPSRR